ncbi:MAG: phenylalanine--tRNA ligase subunit beta [Nitrososphaerales archaeon]
MPVIQLSLSRLEQYCKKKADERKIIEILPYLGLDIEDQAGDIVNIEYSPNRPDFSSEAGVARALVGLLGIETGPPKYFFPPSNFKVSLSGTEIKQTRPFIHAIYSEIPLTDENIKQLIAMQEDLHNGIGRKRSKVAIGIHNAEVISNQIRLYATRDEKFSFVPLGSTKNQNIREILSSTDQGLAYRKLLSGSYPILEDSRGNVLSMPPIINGELTRLRPGLSRLFIDLTGTDERALDATTAIVASMLHDSGGKVYSVEIQQDVGNFWTPDMSPKTMRFDLELTNGILGEEFSVSDAARALERSRIGLYGNGDAIIARYRYDIIHPIDLVEEVALGFGIQKFAAQNLKSSLIGSFSKRQKKIDLVIDVLVGMELTEIWNLSLTSLEQVTHCKRTGLIKVEDSKSQSFEFLRCDIIASLLATLGASTHQEYPQRIFEQAPVFKISEETVSSIAEEDHVSVVIADSGVNYSMIRSVIDGLFRLLLGEKTSISFKQLQEELEPFALGRSAVISMKGADSSEIGVVGEISPKFLERYGLKVPASAFELNLEPFLKD